MEIAYTCSYKCAFMVQRPKYNNIQWSSHILDHLHESHEYCLHYNVDIMIIFTYEDHVYETWSVIDNFMLQYAIRSTIRWIIFMHTN